MPNATLTPPQGPARNAGSTPVEQGDFIIVRNVPVFAEHETTAKDGRKLKFGRAELEAVAARNNERIKLSGDYVPITIGHTPDPMAVMLGKATQPEVVGFAGPFTVGLIGPPGQERYSITADFHVFKEDYPRLRKYPRRSPELWLEDSYAKMFLDPICLLGAETPRLDMGVLYAASLHGRTVEKYTATSPAAGNSFVPSERYAADGDGDDDDADDTNDPPAKVGDEGTEPMNEEKLVAMFLEAFRQSDMGQWLMSQMQKDAAPQPSVPQPDIPTSAPPVADPSGLGGPPPDAGLPAPGGGMPPPDAMGGPPGAMPPSAPPMPAASAATGATPPDVDKEKMNAGGGMMPYQRPAVDRLAALESQVAGLVETAENERRVSQLFELVAGGVPIDDPRSLVVGANARLSYSKATNDQFALVCEQYARQARLPQMGVFLPTPGDAAPGQSAPGGPTRELYSKANADRAMAICNAEIRAGRQPDYARVLADVQAGKV